MGSFQLLFCSGDNICRIGMRNSFKAVINRLKNYFMKYRHLWKHAQNGYKFLSE